MQHLNELTTREISRIITDQGAEFVGLQETRNQRLVMFIDPITRTTLALSEAELCAEAVSLSLERSRHSYAIRQPV